LRNLAVKNSLVEFLICYIIMSQVRMWLAL